MRACVLTTEMCRLSHCVMSKCILFKSCHQVRVKMCSNRQTTIHSLYLSIAATAQHTIRSSHKEQDRLSVQRQVPTAMLSFIRKYTHTDRQSHLCDNLHLLHYLLGAVLCSEGFPFPLLFGHYERTMDAWVLTLPAHHERERWTNLAWQTLLHSTTTSPVHDVSTPKCHSHCCTLMCQQQNITDWLYNATGLRMSDTQL